jgi:hypothetical protein
MSLAFIAAMVAARHRPSKPDLGDPLKIQYVSTGMPVPPTSAREGLQHLENGRELEAARL